MTPRTSDREGIGDGLRRCAPAALLLRAGVVWLGAAGMEGGLTRGETGQLACFRAAISGSRTNTAGWWNRYQLDPDRWFA